MADCKVRTVRMDAILNVIRSLMADESSGVKTADQVLDWFAKKYPQITTEEIIDSLVVTDKRNVDESKKAYRNEMASLRSWAKSVNRLGMFLENTLESHTGTKPEKSPYTEQVQSVFRQFKALAAKDSITPDDIDLTISMVESLPGTGGYSRVEIEGIINNLKGLRKEREAEIDRKRQERLPEKKLESDRKRVERLSERLGGLFKGEVKRVKKTRVPEESHLAEFKEVMRDLNRLANVPGKIDPVQAATIIEKLSGIEEYYAEYYDKDGKASIDNLNKALDNLRDIRKEAKIERLQKSISGIRGKIRNLDDPDSIETKDVLTEKIYSWESTQKEIIRLEVEYEELMQAREAKIDSIRRAAQVQKTADWLKKTWNISGVDGMLKFFYAAKTHGWESIRTLAFFLDHSAPFVQLAQISIQDLSPVLIMMDGLRALAGQKVDPFAGVKRFSDVWFNGFWKVMMSDFKETDKKGGLKHAKGSWAVQKYNELIEHPLYDLMIQSGLKLSRSRSMLDSEEMFKTNMINKIPGLGFLKDVSEDVMVTSLNMYRVLMFEQFYKMHPDLTSEDYSQIAEAINNLTGTTKQGGQVIASAAKVLSAPRLLVAKGKLALVHPVRLGFDMAGNLPNSVKERKLVFSNAANEYMAKNLARIWATYGFLALILPLLGIGAGDEWEEKDFMRIKIGNTAYDLTGGVGAMYRTLAMILLLNGYMPENASYQTKARINYLKNVKGWDTFSALGNFGKGRLHPTINRSYGVATGLDFMGDPYADDIWVARGKAALYGLLPIVAETVDKELKSVMNERTPPIQGLLNVVPIQFHGINAYTTESETSDKRVEDYISKIEYQPSLRYPEMMNKRNGKETDDTIRKKYLKGIYRQMWEDALGKLIIENPEMTKSDLKNQWNSEKRKVDEEFMKKYGEDVKKLKLKE